MAENRHGESNRCQNAFKHGLFAVDAMNKPTITDLSTKGKMMSQFTATRNVGKSRRNAPAIRGGTEVSAPQVSDAYARRLARLGDAAITALERALKSKNGVVSLRAAQDILDRNGLRGDALLKLLEPDSGTQVKPLTDEQAERIRSLPPDEFAIFGRILNYVQTGERDPVHGNWIEMARSGPHG